VSAGKLGSEFGQQLSTTSFRTEGTGSFFSIQPIIKAYASITTMQKACGN